MKIILSKEDKIELLQTMKLGIWDINRTPKFMDKVKRLAKY